MMPLARCPVCGGELLEKEVEKLLRGGNHTAIVRVRAEVCLRAGNGCTRNTLSGVESRQSLNTKRRRNFTWVHLFKRCERLIPRARRLALCAQPSAGPSQIVSAGAIARWPGKQCGAGANQTTPSQ